MREPIQRLWNNTKEIFLSADPIIKALIILLPLAFLIDIASILMGLTDPAEIKAINELFQDPSFSLKEVYYKHAILAALTQEFFFRGPTFLFILLFPQYNERDWRTWIVILLPTFYWMRGHGFEYDALLVGIICGWAVAKTKTLDSAIFIHLIYNTFSIIGGIIRFQLLH